MKAKDYFLKYDEAIMEEAKRPETKTDGPMAKMYIDFFKETGNIAKQRHVKYDRGLIPVIDEQNKKWNAVVNLFIKKYGVTPIKKDGFKLAFYDRINT